MNNEILNTFFSRYNQLGQIKEEIISAYSLMESAYKDNKKLLIAGNGGSAADASHIAGELMKCFRLPRPVSDDFAKALRNINNEKGAILSELLETPLRAISLTDMDALSTAYINDRAADTVFAQKLFGLADQDDVFLGITTSGNSKNVVLAAITAKAMGVKVIALTGANGGEIEKYADITVKVPETETFMIQELHLPIYHFWCQMLEDSFFNS